MCAAREESILVKNGDRVGFEEVVVHKAFEQRKHLNLAMMTINMADNDDKRVFCGHHCCWLRQLPA